VNRRLQAYLPVAVLALMMIALQFIGPQALRYDPQAVRQGELWRLISGHFVHANLRHLLLNLSGLWLCQALTGINWSLWQWLWRSLALALSISLAFWLLQPQLRGYVGFSGVLFGLYLLAAVRSLPRQPLVSSLLLLSVLAKILMEQFSSVKISSSEWIGVPVLVDAHLYGFLAALLLAIARQAAHRIRTPTA
jgi:rhomboid family GlyGly-CTERM serine protease